MKKYTQDEILKILCATEKRKHFPTGDYSEWKLYDASTECEIFFEPGCVFAKGTTFDKVQFLGDAHFGKNTRFKECVFVVSMNFPKGCIFVDMPFYTGNTFGDGCKFMTGGAMTCYGINNTFGKKCVFDIRAFTSGKCTFGKKCIRLTKEGGYEKIKAGKRKLKEVYPE